MNHNSYLCRFIAAHPNDWQTALKEKNIDTKINGDLAIFNYGINADFTDNDVREARGIIIRTDTLDVICWPFTKFMNAHEHAAYIDLDNFDWNNAVCQDKIDGSIVKLFFNSFTHTWQWATNSCINANEARTQSDTGESYMDIINQADNYYQIPFETLNKELTYIFELVSPATQVVIKYPTTHLYHIGTRNNMTGQETNPDIGIEKPAQYPVTSLKECITAARKLNPDGNDVTKEGFVVRDNQFHRVKVKSPEYIALHHMPKNTFPKNRVIELMRDMHISCEQLCHDFPLYELTFKYYSYKMTELEWDIQRFINYTRALYTEYNQDRKALAQDIANLKYAGFGFCALNNEKTAKELLDNLSLSQYQKLIDPYTPHPVNMPAKRKYYENNN